MSDTDAPDFENLREGSIYVAGHRGMVGSALVRHLETAGCARILTKSSSELDLTDQRQVNDFFEREQPDFVFLAAARVGGINANNTFPARFIYDNMMIAANVIAAAHANGTSRLLFLGSSCIYPRLAPQPMSEEALLTGTLEPTNEPYAIAKIAGIKLCESFNREYGTDYRSVMPTNLYGPNDNFDLETSHVLPALIRKFHEAKTAGADIVEIWGTGEPRREFLHVDDLADACLFVMTLEKSTYESVTKPMLSHINVGTGTDMTIRELAEVISATVGFEGRIVCNTAYPDGTPRKLLNIDKLKKLGWTPSISLADGIRDTYRWFVGNAAK